MPSASTSSSCVAFMSASTVPKWRASVCAVTQPTSEMFRPKSTRENGIAFDASIAATALPASISP